MGTPNLEVEGKPPRLAGGYDRAMPIHIRTDRIFDTCRIQPLSEVAR